MLYHITVEQVETDAGLQWEGKIEEFPDIAEYSDGLTECLELVADSILCLQERT